MTTMLLKSSRPIQTGPRPLRWTCAEFHNAGDMGIFEGRQAMLINGVIMEEGPMNPPHAETQELVENTIRTAFGAGWRIRGQLPLVLGQDLDPEPDIAVMAGTPRGNSGHPTMADLVIEIADSSLDFDTNEKRFLYATAGIRDYWVVDIYGRRLLVYRDPQAGDYTTHLAFGPADAIAPLATTMVVKSVGKGKDVYFLNSKEDFKDKQNFTVFIKKEASEKFKDAKIDDPVAHFKDKKIRVTGKVELFREKAEIVIEKLDQIELIDKDKSDKKPEEKKVPN